MDLTCPRCGGRAELVMRKQHLARCDACSALIDACPQLGCEEPRELPESVPGLALVRSDPDGGLRTDPYRSSHQEIESFELTWPRSPLNSESVGLAVALAALLVALSLLLHPGWLFVAYPLSIAYLAAGHILHRDNQIVLTPDQVAWRRGGLLPRRWQALSRDGIEELYCTMVGRDRYQIWARPRGQHAVLIGDDLTRPEHALYADHHLQRALGAHSAERSEAT